MSKIRIINGPGKGSVYRLGTTPMLLGRDSSSDIQVLDRGASRSHAELFRVGELCFLRDLESRNGTYVNDELITEELLRDGDRIAIGSTTLLFETDSSSTSQYHSEGRMVAFTETEELDESSSVELSIEDLFLEGDFSTESKPTDFQAIYQLSKILMEETDQRVMLDKVGEFLAQLVPADNIFVFTRDQAHGGLTPTYHYSRNKANRQTTVSRTIVKRSLEQVRAILTSDAMADARFKTEESIVLNRIRGVIAIPLVARRQAFGVLYLDSSSQDNPFSEDDLELLTVIGSQISLSVENISVVRRQREMFMSTIQTLVSLYEHRSPNERGHSDRVAAFSAVIARHMGLGRKEAWQAQLAGLLHDIGKAASNELRREMSDTPKENDIAETDGESVEHVAIGEEVVQTIKGAEEIAPAIKHHHERYDGQGFPDKLEKNDIPELAAIVAVADTLDHLLNPTSTNEEPLSLEAAMEKIKDNSGTRFSPETVEAAFKAFEDGELLSSAVGPAFYSKKNDNPEDKNKDKE